METLIKSNPARIYISRHINATHTERTFWKGMESNRFAIIPILLVVIGCLGALSASFGAEGNITKLAIVAFPTSIATSLFSAHEDCFLRQYYCHRCGFDFSRLLSV